MCEDRNQKHFCFFSAIISPKKLNRANRFLCLNKSFCFFFLVCNCGQTSLSSLNTPSCLQHCRNHTLISLKHLCFSCLASPHKTRSFPLGSHAACKTILAVTFHIRRTGAVLNHFKMKL